MEREDIYRELQRHLDHMPVPYPATESGVELRILKQLFTPDEARVALLLSAIPEPLETIHSRFEMSREELAALLDRMAEKGSINKLRGKRGPVYGKAPLVVGMYEAQVNRLTPELERDMRAYFDGAFGSALHSMRTPQMRTVPVNRSIEVEHAVSTYDDIRKFVENSPGPFAALNCICRQGKDLTGEPCRQTNERQNCLVFGAAAQAMIEKAAAAREVDKQEMLGLLEQADSEGLVLEPQNTQEPLFVCCCCGCCCGVLTTAKKLPKPSDAFQTGFVAELDSGTCDVCGMCATRCQMDAITQDDYSPKLLVERCIGCGLCVTTCPSGALRLRKLDGRKPPPRSTKALYLRIFQERFGCVGAAGALAGHALGRKF